MSTASDCSLFEESKLCISKLTNLIYRQPVEDEAVCQELCQSYLQCSHFTFMESKYPLPTGKPDLQCYMWKRCISKVTVFMHKKITFKWTKVMTISRRISFFTFLFRCPALQWTASPQWSVQVAPQWFQPAALSSNQVSVIPQKSRLSLPWMRWSARRGAEQRRGAASTPPPPTPASSIPCVLRRGNLVKGAAQGRRGLR